MTVGDHTQSSAKQLLLRSVAEELKLPLMQIAREAELHSSEGISSSEGFKRMQIHADMALVLVDSYLLGLELNENQTELELEAVSVSGVLNDTAHTLYDFAKQYNVTLELKSAGKYGPVMAHAAGLKAALFSLGYALVGSTLSRQVTLGLHQSRQGIVAGVYGDFEELANTQLQQARSLYGRARQPFQAMFGGTAAGVFVADTIFQAMASNLRVSRHQRQAGLAATLQPSQQLALV